jgi:cation diffusion facilitator CzcD-associated flavoprotein CzcO
LCFLGWHGLAAAKTYLEVNPSVEVILLDSACTVGGVWAEHKLYPGLKSNNMLGTYEYSDFPMDTATYGVKPGEHIPGHVLHQYLTDFAKKFDLLRRIRFETKVESAEYKEGGGWIITISKGFSDKDALAKSEIFAPKLIVATGMTSEAFLPKFAGSESFGAPLFHSRYFSDYASTLDTAKNVCVLGGTKSAWDAVYAYASTGIKVDWVIRGMFSAWFITCGI